MKGRKYAYEIITPFACLSYLIFTLRATDRPFDMTLNSYFITLDSVKTARKKTKKKIVKYKDTKFHNM